MLEEEVINSVVRRSFDLSIEVLLVPVLWRTRMVLHMGPKGYEAQRQTNREPGILSTPTGPAVGIPVVPRGGTPSRRTS
jgi:hypothetical protein